MPYFQENDDRTFANFYQWRFWDKQTQEPGDIAELVI